MLTRSSLQRAPHQIARVGGKLSLPGVFLGHAVLVLAINERKLSGIHLLDRISIATLHEHAKRNYCRVPSSNTERWYFGSHGVRTDSPLLAYFLQGRRAFALSKHQRKNGRGIRHQLIERCDINVDFAARGSSLGCEGCYLWYCSPNIQVRPRLVVIRSAHLIRRVCHGCQLRCLVNWRGS